MGHFLPFHPPLKTQKIRIAGDNIILHTCTKNHNHVRYGSWDRQNFLSFWAIFYPFYPPNNPENQNFETIKEASRDVIILHMCTNNHDHMMYAPWDIECNRHHFLSLWAIFCPFTPLTTEKSIFWKNEKITWTYHHLLLYDVWFLRYGVQQTESFVILDYFLLFYLPLTLPPLTI